MATLKLQIEDSKFVSHNGVNVEKFTEREVEANGWYCQISETGRLDCIATQFYRNERHQIKLKINKGWAKLLLKIGNGRPIVLRSFKIEPWPANGIVVLPTGYIDKRRPHFRDATFLKFLEEYSITAVRYEEANGIYKIIKEYDGHMIVFAESIETDGKMKVISEDIKPNKISDETSFIVEEMLEVTDSTWVLKEVEKNYQYQHRILYTLGNPQEIVGLPKLQ